MQRFQPAFNQDNTCVAVTTRTGYCLYQCSPFSSLYTSDNDGYGIVKMLHTTSLVFLVGSGTKATVSSRTLYVRNIQTNEELCKFNFESAILNLLVNDQRVVVVLKNRIHLVDIRTLKHIQELEIPENDSGCCALSPSGSRCLVTYPCNPPYGEILVYDALNLQVVTVIAAHHNPVKCMCFNSDGSLLATTSTKGTVIRIFSVLDGVKRFTFRRGSYPVNVYSLSFNPSSSLIALTSDSTTVHVFNLNESTNETQSDTPTTKRLTDMIGLPTLLQDMVEPLRNFARIHLKENVPPTYCGFVNDNALLIIPSTGIMYQFLVPRDGGECVVQAENSLLNQPSEAIGVKFHESAPTSPG